MARRGIAEIGDVERMAKYAIELLTNDARREMFAKAGRKRAVENFDIEQIVVQYERHYERILNAKPALVL